MQAVTDKNNEQNMLQLGEPSSSADGDDHRQAMPSMLRMVLPLLTLPIPQLPLLTCARPKQPPLMSLETLGQLPQQLMPSWTAPAAPLFLPPAAGLCRTVLEATADPVRYAHLLSWSAVSAFSPFQPFGQPGRLHVGIVINVACIPDGGVTPRPFPTRDTHNHLSHPQHCFRQLSGKQLRHCTVSSPCIGIKSSAESCTQ